MSRPDPVTREIAPCNGCEERCVTETFNCHDHCPKDKRGEFGYKAWKANLEKVKEERLKYAQSHFNSNKHDFYKH